MKPTLRPPKGYRLFIPQKGDVKQRGDKVFGLISRKWFAVYMDWPFEDSCCYARKIKKVSK